MKRLMTGLGAGAVALLASGTAFAADLYGSPRGSMKDDMPAPYRACSGDRFAGFYAGANLGMTNLNSKWEETFADFTPDYQDHPLKTTRGSVSGGGQIGYNRVRCNFLFGLEADYNFAHASGSTDHFPLDPTQSGPGYANISDSIKGYATLRGRLGFVADRTLFYATGGLAWADLRHSLKDIGHFDGGNQDGVSQYSSWKQGWTLGAGFEHALTEVISLKGEALYMDFGKRSYSFNDSATPPDFYAFQTRTDVWSARVGLNFKLGDFPPRGGHNDGCDHSACGYAPKK